CVFTPIACNRYTHGHIIPYADSHDTRLGRESSWPQVPSGLHLFRLLMVKGPFCALTGRAAFVFRGNVTFVYRCLPSTIARRSRASSSGMVRPFRSSVR